MILSLKVYALLRIHFNKEDKIKSDPTPEEIKEMCSKIQTEWDERTEYQRRVTKSEPVSFPRVRVSIEYEE